MFENVEVEQRKDIGHAQRPGRVTAAGGHEHFDDALADLIGFTLELGHLGIGEIIHQCIIPDRNRMQR